MTPIKVPPIRLIKVIKRPAVASPLTYFVAPSIEPKKEDSSCNFCLLSRASFSVIAPVFKSASIAICLPGIASSVNLAETSATRSEPLLITMNCTMIRTIKMMAPITRSPPPTNCPNVSTTFPGEPVLRIRRVDETFREIRKIVVNKSRVGKKDISKTSRTNKTFIRTINATEILSASITSNNIEGIGTMKKIIAANRYAATPISVFLTPDRSIPFPPFHRISHLTLS